MHSNYSDGNDTIEEIMNAANESGVDFVITTDHDTLKPGSDGLEKWHGSALLIVGTEITPRQNHFIAFGAGRFDDLDGLKNKTPQEIINVVNRNKWAGFIAHPDYTGSNKLDVGDYGWKEWNVSGFTGISVWHLVSNWLDQVNKSEKLDISLYDKFESVVKAPLKGALERWDNMLLKDKVVGICEIDNHSAKKNYEGQEITIFPLNRVFNTLLNHVILSEPLSPDAETAKLQVVEAFKSGSLFLCHGLVGNSDDFYFRIEMGEKVAYAGGELVLDGEGELEISLPEEATIRVICDGRVFKEVNSFELVEPITAKGYYRAEVYKGDRCWIITNPIYVR